MDNGTLSGEKIRAFLAGEYVHPEFVNVTFRGLLPGHKRPEEFIEAWCEVLDEATLKVNREMTETDIALLGPHLGEVGTCTWFDKGGNQLRGDKAGELLLTCHCAFTCGV
jgi:hypothetical protein